MKISKKRALALFIVPVAVIVLSGCGAKDKTSTPTPAPAPQQSMPIPAETPAATNENELPSLPADNKQAIEAEIQDIDQTLQEAENSFSADTQDEELGF